MRANLLAAGRHTTLPMSSSQHIQTRRRESAGAINQEVLCFRARAIQTVPPLGCCRLAERRVLPDGLAAGSQYQVFVVGDGQSRVVFCSWRCGWIAHVAATLEFSLKQLSSSLVRDHENLHWPWRRAHTLWLLHIGILDNFCTNTTRKPVKVNRPYRVAARFSLQWLKLQISTTQESRFHSGAACEAISEFELWKHDSSFRMGDHS